MRDRTLADLIDRSMAMPYPPGLAGERINGVEVVLLDPEIIGYGYRYAGNLDPMSEADRSKLVGLLADCDAILPDLPNEYAREMFGRVRAVAAHLLDKR
jgi:hypothetical protein